jgi:Coenzyme PQQ synthesis protein D (PqqD)
MSKLYVARNPRVAARGLGGETMIMSGRDSTLFTLNKTATILWQAADGSTPLDKIVQERICSEFEVEPAEALHDAETLARELAGHGILQLSEEPIPQTSSSVGAQPVGAQVGEQR